MLHWGGEYVTGAAIGLLLSSSVANTDKRALGFGDPGGGAFAGDLFGNTGPSSTISSSEPESSSLSGSGAVAAAVVAATDAAAAAISAAISAADDMLDNV